MKRIKLPSIGLRPASIGQVRLRHAHQLHRPTPRVKNIPSPFIPGFHKLSRSASEQAKPPDKLPTSSTAPPATSDSPLRHTPLYDLHVAHGGKMVPFAGYSMPVQYENLSISESHKWTRENASIFDVSHMVQHYISGPGAQELLLRITPSSIVTLPTHHSTLSVLLLPQTGGIVDDCVITRLGPESFYIVTNGATRDKDLAFLDEHINASNDPKSINWEVLEGWGLLALQGPKAAWVLEHFLSRPDADDLPSLHFGQSRMLPLRLELEGEPTAPVHVARGGYTGEDGFELSLPPPIAEKVARAFLGINQEREESVHLAGLGARDSLRMEAGMCLYGHDLDETITPVEAGLGWVVGKDRRTEGGFNGDGVILRQLKPKKDGGTGVEKRRVGLVIEGAPAREGAEIVGDGDEVVGKVTSGCPGPTIGKNIAMGYVKSGMHKSGTELGVLVRGKRRKATVTKMPFVETKYWRG